MLNLGPRPTFADPRVTIEAHLFDTGGDLYGAYVRIEFLAWLRETRVFDGVEALRAQLARDDEAARRVTAVRPRGGSA
jgi:riboflavin kinase/FMN adenylyltransferase